MDYRRPLSGALALALIALVFAAGIRSRPTSGQPATQPDDAMQKRWLFVWRDLGDPAEVDRMIARFPGARAAGYNGVVFSHRIAEGKAEELRRAAGEHDLDIIATVMGGSQDRNYMEGVLCKDALFVVEGDDGELGVRAQRQVGRQLPRRGLLRGGGSGRYRDLVGRLPLIGEDQRPRAVLLGGADPRE